MIDAITQHQTAQRWEQLYAQVPLVEVPRHFAGIGHSPFLQQYLATVLRLCPRGGTTCETGVGSGYGAIWLSLRGVQASGIDLSSGIVERARQINNILSGSAHFEVGDLFGLYEAHRNKKRHHSASSARYDVIHHQGVLEHFTVPYIRAALAQQVACAHHVVFSVPSVYYPFDPEFGDERLLPLEEWERILAPFDIEELRLYGDPQCGEHEHVLCVLRGQEVNDTLHTLMTPPAEPYPMGISGIVHTRNEERHLAACLETLQGWTDEIIVCDMESTDRTLEIARSFTDQIISHPPIRNFDRARNASAMRARYRWIFYLDADERVPPELGAALRHLVEAQAQRPDGEEFAGALPPFRHFFAGQWLRCLYPGYTAPRLLKNGNFSFNPRLHSGAQVQGNLTLLPADNPDLALQHHSYDSFAHYLDKLNRYTDGEAESLHRDGVPFHWQGAMRHFARDLKEYYDGREARQDGVHGFVYSFLSAFYRFEQHAKLYERRFRQGQLRPEEQQIPQSAEEILEYALSVLREKPLPPASEIRVASAPVKATENGALASIPAEVVWSGPIFDPSGYGEECRNFALALQEAGVPVAVQNLPWSEDRVCLTPEEERRLGEMDRPALPGFVQVVQTFPPNFSRHPQAGVTVGRTMFETDRLPEAWVAGCNRMDYVWVPSEFNRESFARAGVAEEKLRVMPGCFEPEPYLQSESPPASCPPVLQELLAEIEAVRERGGYSFMSVFDWTRHKGWDVLLRAFLREFKDEPDVRLVFKVWSTMGYSHEDIKQQAATLCCEELGHDLLRDPRVLWLPERVDGDGLRALYQSCDAFVLPSRGEGWGRPYMEAMACGKPVIGTNWSGNTAFMTGEDSYLIECEVRDVPEVGWREIPTYWGHRWAEPDESHLRELMRGVVENREEAAAKGGVAQEDVSTRFSRKAVGQLLRAELERLQNRAGERPKAQQAAAARSTKQKQANGSNSDPSDSLLLLPPGVRPAHRETMSRERTPVRVRWEGAFFEGHSLSLVNQEMGLALLGTGAVELSLAPLGPVAPPHVHEPQSERLAQRCFVPLTEGVEVHVRHAFPPRLNCPNEGRFVLIQPWEYGFLPRQWIEPIQENVDEVWCYSEYVREVYVASGIPAEKLQVVPLGVDTSVFQPQAPSYVFTDEPGAAAWHALQSRLEGKRRKAVSTAKQESKEPQEAKEQQEAARPFAFLFCGGTLHRKGIDILLEAYAKAFTPLDEVCLVIKDTGTQTVYRGQNERDRILQLTQDASRPPIVYLDEELSSHRLAGLYTACDCLVQPYRGEGFCLPALEAMACGLPVLVTEGGPTDDFVDETVGWRIPSERVPFGISPQTGLGRIGDWECCGPTWMWEVSPDDLAHLMREVYRDQVEARQRGMAGAKRAREGWTWEHTAQVALERLQVLTTSKEKTSPSSGLLLLPEKTTRSKAVQNGKSKAGVSAASAIVNGISKPRTANISLCMIVRDEERVLDACLQSAKPWFDEVIVVDTGSKDRTVEIAESHGAKVFHFPWCDDFSAARNESLHHATGDWVFWMDADDTLPEECGRKLRELALLAEDKTMGFLAQVHIPPAPGETGFTIVDHLKLFRNLPELRFEGRLHEQILESINRVGGQIARSDAYVVHSGYDYSPEGQKKKRARDLSLLEQDLAERPDHPFVLFNIGMTAYHMKEYAKAQQFLERCLEKSGPQESTIRKVYAMLSGCHLEREQVPQAIERVEQGLAAFPNDPELLFRAGIIYHRAGDLGAAERSYVKLLTHSERGHIDSLDVSITGYKAHHNLAVVYRDMGQLSEAEAQFKAAIGLSPQFVPAWLGLGDLFRGMGRLEELENLVHALQEFAPQEAQQFQLTRRHAHV